MKNFIGLITTISISITAIANTQFGKTYTQKLLQEMNFINDTKTGIKNSQGVCAGLTPTKCVESRLQAEPPKSVTGMASWLSTAVGAAHVEFQKDGKQTDEGIARQLELFVTIFEKTNPEKYFIQEIPTPTVTEKSEKAKLMSLEKFAEKDEFFKKMDALIEKIEKPSDKKPKDFDQKLAKIKQRFQKLKSKNFVPVSN